MKSTNVQESRDRSGGLQNPFVDVVDFGGGNIGSVVRCLDRLEIHYQIVNPENPPDGSNPLILPGVGAFGAVMNGLRQREFDKRIVDLVNNGTQYLGICVGLQILFESSEESPGVSGLSLLEGTNSKFTAGKVPQIGWNHVQGKDQSYPNGYVYFVNSYYPQPVDEAVVSYSANYYVRFCAAVQHNNITGFQFHPEKSGEFGRELLKRWVSNACQ